MAGKAIVLFVFTIGIVYAGAQDYQGPPPAAHIGEIEPEFIPTFPAIDFNRVLGEYMLKMEEFHQRLAASHRTGTYAFTTQDLDGKVAASSSLVYDDPSIAAMHERYAKEMATHGLRDPGRSNSAFAGASIGPGGAYQTAALYPQNPASPNIINKFTRVRNAAAQGRPYYYGVMSSSSSGTSNINGRVNRYGHSETTINDNGKVTTYQLRHP